MLAKSFFYISLLCLLESRQFLQFDKKKLFYEWWKFSSSIPNNRSRFRQKICHEGLFKEIIWGKINWQFIVATYRHHSAWVFCWKIETKKVSSDNFFSFSPLYWLALPSRDKQRNTFFLLRGIIIIRKQRVEKDHKNIIVSFSISIFALQWASNTTVSERKEKKKWKKQTQNRKRGGKYLFTTKWLSHV